MLTFTNSHPEYPGIPIPGTCGLLGSRSVKVSTCFTSLDWCPKARKGGFPVIRAFGSSGIEFRGYKLPRCSPFASQGALTVSFLKGIELTRRRKRMEFLKAFFFFVKKVGGGENCLIEMSSLPTNSGAECLDVFFFLGCLISDSFIELWVSLLVEFAFEMKFHGRYLARGGNGAGAWKTPRCKGAKEFTFFLLEIIFV